MHASNNTMFCFLLPCHINDQERMPHTVHLIGGPPAPSPPRVLYNTNKYFTIYIYIYIQNKKKEKERNDSSPRHETSGGLGVGTKPPRRQEPKIIFKSFLLSVNLYYVIASACPLLYVVIWCLSWIVLRTLIQVAQVLLYHKRAWMATPDVPWQAWNPGCHCSQELAFSLVLHNSRKLPIPFFTVLPVRRIPEFP